MEAKGSASFAFLTLIHLRSFSNAIFLCFLLVPLAQVCRWDYVALLRCGFQKPVVVFAGSQSEAEPRDIQGR
jgi:hypothetical protein